MQVGLLFGSFDPIHQGHLMLGQYMLQFEELDEVWYVLSPQNPLKSPLQLSDVPHRLNMLRLALGTSSRLKVCERELSMPAPSYTIDTLKTLTRENPGVQFSIIMGTDNIATIDKWKDYKTILDNHQILVYPRLGFPEPAIQHSNIKTTQAPVVDLSATNIRSWVRAGKDVRHFIPLQVYQYIVDKGLYGR